MIRMSVVLPDPFGPSTPTTLPRGTCRLTPSRTSRGGLSLPRPNAVAGRRSTSYENETLSTCSNAHPDETGTPERRIPECFFVLPVGDVVHASEELEP